MSSLSVAVPSPRPASTSPAPSPLPDPAVDEAEEELLIDEALRASQDDPSPSPSPSSPDPSIAPSGTDLLDDLLRRASAYMATTAVGADLGDLTDHITKKAASTSRSKGSGAGGHKRLSEKEEDELMIHELQEEGVEGGEGGEEESMGLPAASSGAPSSLLHLLTQPSCIHGKMRGYQLEGLNWLLRLYGSGVSGILADEMGLGKTLQSISLLGYLNQCHLNKGPHLVLTPLSTLGNWYREFTHWCPSMRVLKFHGTKEERAIMISEGRLTMRDYDVCLTSYEMAIREKSQLNKHKWQFIVVDEAHRLKNENSLLSVIVRFFKSRYRLLLTGTPLQNNLHELWALLNFLLPQLFSSAHDFDAIFSAAEQDSQSDRGEILLSSLHRLLRPFMLRRLKSQVAQDLPPKKISLIYTGLSEIQRRLYKGILEKDLDTILGTVKERSRLMNMVMQLRKVADHPFLFDGVEDVNAPLHGDHLITVCGKMIVLDKLLQHLAARGSRVLIFSQMTRMLDILEDYLVYKRLAYCRIDGNTATIDREEQMRIYNEPGSLRFVFLLSTRAGGLGINLSSADTVILYDSDWNPQMDLQAMDRAHRIGQTKTVNVLRLICEDTVEVQMLKRAEIKLHLDAMVIQTGKLQSGKSTTALTTEDLTKMIRYGADKIFRQTESTVTDEDIINILERGEQTAAQLQESAKQHVNMMDLTFDGTVPDTSNNDALNSLLPDDGGTAGLSPEELQLYMATKFHDALGKRERKKSSYNDDQAFRALIVTSKAKSLLNKPHRLPKMMEHQFYQRERIEELSDKEMKFYIQHQYNQQPPALTGLSDVEVAELDRLLDEGFSEWTYSDHQRFLQACYRYGRNNLEKLTMMMGTRKNKEQVAHYHATFLQRLPTLRNYQSILTKIERAETRVAKYAEMEELLESSLSLYNNNRAAILSTLPIRYSPINKEKGYTIEEDRLLLWACHRVGFGEWRALRELLMNDTSTVCDYWLLAKNDIELERRVKLLLREIERMKINAAAASSGSGHQGGQGGHASSNGAAGRAPVASSASNKSQSYVSPANASHKRKSSSGADRAEHAEPSKKKQSKR